MEPEAHTGVSAEAVLEEIHCGMDEALTALEVLAHTRSLRPHTLVAEGLIH
jgi:hypothetical protein